MKKRLCALLVTCGALFHHHLFAQDPTTPLMVDHSHGWWKKESGTGLKILYTSDIGKHWLDVSPPSLKHIVQDMIATKGSEGLSDNVAFCPLDNQQAWIAVTVKDRIFLEYTASAGRYWRVSPGPEAKDAVFISFLNGREGFILTMTGSLGSHREWVYHTADTGLHWVPIGSPGREGTSYYADGITFRNPREGWITATYHGAPDAPLFRTGDGGKTWNLQQIPVPDDYKGGYANTYPPVFFGPDKKKGYLPVKLVRHTPSPDHEAEVKYETDNGGATWHLPASGVHSQPFD